MACIPQPSAAYGIRAVPADGVSMAIDFLQKQVKPNKGTLAVGPYARSITFARTRSLLYWIAEVRDRASAGGIAWPNR